MRMPVRRELRRDAAHEADHRVLRQRVDRIHRRRRQPRERRGRDDRAAVRHQPRRTARARRRRRRRRSRAARAGTARRSAPPCRPRRVTMPAFRNAASNSPSSARHASASPTSKPPARPSDTISASPSAAANARPSPPLPARDQRPHGTSTTLPTLRRDSTSSCARSTSSSGSSAPTSGVNAPVCQSAEQLADRAADELRVEPQQPPEVEALHADVPADEARRVRSPATAPPRSRARAATPSGFSRAIALREELAADRVDDHVGLEVVGQLVVDVRLGCAELAAHVELLRRADRGDHPRAERARELDRRRADAARGRVHEHRRPRVERAPAASAGCTPSGT